MMYTAATRIVVCFLSAFIASPAWGNAQQEPADASQDKREAVEQYAAAYKELDQAWQRRDFAVVATLGKTTSELGAKAFGENTLEVARPLSLAASALLEMQKAVEAEPIARRSLAIHRLLEGDASQSALSAYALLAKALNQQQKWKPAEGLSRSGLKHAAQLKEPTRSTFDLNVALGLSLLRQKRFAEAVTTHEQTIAIADKIPPLGPLAMATVLQRHADCLHGLRQHPKAETSIRRALAIHRKYRRDHPTRHADLRVGASLWNLGANLQGQAELFGDRSKLSESESALRESIQLRETLLPRHHREMSVAKRTLAVTLRLLYRFDESIDLFRELWEISRDHSGPTHPETLRRLTQYASNIQDRWPFQKVEPVMRLAVQLHEQAYGDAPQTRSVLRLLARKLDHHNRFVEALEIRHKLLRQVRRLYGENNANTAGAYKGLGVTLSYQKKNAQAVRCYEKSLEIEEALGLNGTLGYGDTLHSLAISNLKLGDLDKGIAYCRQALAIHTRQQDNPQSNVPLFRNTLAVILSSKGDYEEAYEIYEGLAKRWRNGGPVELAIHGMAAVKLQTHEFDRAEELYRELLAIEKASGGQPSHGTAVSHRQYLAFLLHVRGAKKEAMQLLKESESIYASLRRNWALAGLDRAIIGLPNPGEGLAVMLAEQGRAEEAWQKWEATRARGMLDELSFRQRQQLPSNEVALRAKLLESLRSVEGKLEAADPGSQEEVALRQELSELQQERFGIEKQLLETSGGQETVALAELQAVLPADAALVGWLDPFYSQKDGLSDHHWGVVIRSRGAPHWVKLPGGKGGAWTPDDRSVRRRIVDHMIAKDETRTATFAADAKRLADLRLSPLAPHFAASDGLPPATHLIVIPSNAVKGVSIQSLDERYSVSYAPSATVYTWLANRRLRLGHKGKPRVLALADPVFEKPDASRGESLIPETESPQTTRPTGVTLAATPPDVRERWGVKAGDIVLKYNGVRTQTPADLAAAIAKAPMGTAIEVHYWRAGKPHTTQGTGSFQATASPLASDQLQRFEGHVAMVLRGAEEPQLPDLPGTRREVSALAREVSRVDGSIELLLGEEATESTLHAMNRDAQLDDYRYIHLATHGIVNANEPMRSALILSPESSSSQEADQRLTAGEMLSTWKLNAELVTLSACQTALGRYENGEGHIGFAQSLLLAGADSVLLSLWKVDDAATALLMQRFYQNVLGTRAGLIEPMSKHDALREAQLWLRDLETRDANDHIDKLPQLSRGLRIRRKKVPLVRPRKVNAENRPYANPFFWSGFVLVGRSE